MEKRYSSMILLSLVLLTFLPMVSAQSGVTDTLDNWLNGFANWILGQDDANSLREFSDKLWIPVFAVFTLVFTLVFASAMFIPVMQGNKNWAAAIAAVFGVAAISTPGLVAMIWSLGSIFIIIISVSTLIYLFIMVMRGLRSGAKRAEAELNKAKTEERKERDKLNIAEKRHRKSEKSLEDFNKVVEREDEAVGNITKSLDKELQRNRALSSRLEAAERNLRELEKIGPATAEGQKIKDSLLGELSVVLNNTESEIDLLERIEHVQKQLKKMEDSEYKDIKDLDAMMNKMRKVHGIGDREYDKIEEELKVHANKILNLVKQKQEITKQVNKLGKDSEKLYEEFEKELRALIGYIRNNSIPSALQQIRRLREFSAKEEKILRTLEDGYTNVSNADVRIEKLNNEVIALIHEAERDLAK